MINKAPSRFAVVASVLLFAAIAIGALRSGHTAQASDQQASQPKAQAVAPQDSQTSDAAVTNDPGIVPQQYHMPDPNADVVSPQDAAAQIAQADQADQTPTPTPPASQWWVATLNHDSCNIDGSPADQIRELQGAGEDAQTSDTTDAYGRLVKVEVSYEADNGKEIYWTFFRSQQDCLASLPVNHPVSSEYE